MYTQYLQRICFEISRQSIIFAFSIELKNLCTVESVLNARNNYLVKSREEILAGFKTRFYFSKTAKSQN